MKKVLFVALFATLFIGVSNAQQVHFGLKGGYVRSTLEINDNKYTDEYRNAAFGGIFLTVKTSYRWAFQPEILYVPQGVEMVKHISNNEVKSSLNLNYVQVPLLAKYYFTPKWSMEFGPQFLILASSNFETEAFGKTTTIDIDDEVSGSDIGIAFGFSYNFTYKWFINLRMNAGFKNAFNSDYKLKGFNRSLQFSLAYAF